METSFDPPRLLRSRHVQTLCAAVPAYTPPKRLRGWPTTPMRFPIDGGALRAIAHLRAKPERTVVLVHGIGGASDSKYVVRAAAAFWERGWDVVRLNLRGAGDSMVEMPSFYHAGLTSDLDVVLRELAKRPGSLYVVGFSGGGSLALKLAGEWGAQAPRFVRAVTSISAPLDYVQVARQMEKLRTLPYRRFVLGNLVRQAAAFAKHLPDLAPYSVEQISRVRTFRAFDATAIVPMHGFPDVDTYHRTSSSGPYLPRITVPTCVVHADDDPMVPGRTLLPWIDAASRAVSFVRSARGGHVGFISGLSEDDWVKSWAMRRVLDFVGRVRSSGVS